MEIALVFASKFSKSKTYEVRIDDEPIGTVESDDSGRNWCWKLRDWTCPIYLIPTGDVYLWNSRAAAVDRLVKAHSRQKV